MYTYTHGRQSGRLSTLIQAVLQSFCFLTIQIPGTFEIRQTSCPFLQLILQLEGYKVGWYLFTIVKGYYQQKY